jgi:DNA primase
VAVIDDIKVRLDILEVVGQRVQLQRSGRSYKGNCPFHQERTPSFHVFPDRQSWRCFGACATGGSAIDFVMRSENLEFGETIRRLAQQVGLPLNDRQSSRADHPAFRINEAACAFFQRTLASSQGSYARAYMERRGLDRSAIELFQLGLAPSDGESLRSHLLREGFEAAQLLAAGIVRENDDRQQRDLFWGRLMIPIRDSDSRLAGFGGRALDDSQPKYLNSPQSEVFDKSRILYAMDRARDDIRRSGAVIVEGYMDAIAAHQAGFRNVVASMGTALTEPQVNAIRRLTDQVTMALDQDAAGQQATLRSLESSWRVYHARVAGRSGGAEVLQRQDNPEIRIAAMPPGQDPDEVIRRSPEEWKSLMAGAAPMLEFVIAAMAASVDTSSPRGKAAIADQVSRLIFAVPDAPQQDHYFRMLAERLEVPLDTLRASITRPAAARRARSAAASQMPGAAQDEATASPFARVDHDPVEDYCLALLIRYPDLIECAEALTEDMFVRPGNREIFTRYLPIVARQPEDRNTGSLAVDEGVIGEAPPGILEQAPPGILEQLEALKSKTLLSMDLIKRRRAFGEVVARLEERSLRQQKKDEFDRFSGAGEGLNDEDHQAAVAVNERLRKNQDLRPSIRGR